VTWRPLGLGFRGWCLSALGQPEQGIPLMIAGLSDIQAILAPLVLTLLGAAHRMASQPQVALKYVTEAVQSAETTSAKWLLSETLRLRGDLLALTGDRIAAEASLHEAIALTRYQGANSSSFGPQLVSPGSGATRARSRMRRSCLLRSTAGLRRGSITPSCGTRRRYSTSWRRERVEWPWATSEFGPVRDMLSDTADVWSSE
jgi:hypothetical protein